MLARQEMTFPVYGLTSRVQGEAIAAAFVFRAIAPVVFGAR